MISYIAYLYKYLCLNKRDILMQNDGVNRLERGEFFDDYITYSDTY